ncbi:MAG TPA: hypothetical protein VNA19_17390 [Pyrinomonadaceae bacterium]|jgi:hypothetical protein|nr:hypothetical protein [Pyrinomonadaceae bacterium]
MPRLPRDFGKPPRPSNPPRPSSAEADSASDNVSLVNYPNLERLFEKPDFSALEEMRTRLKRSVQSIERVLRHGSKEESERAVRAAAAYRTMLELLDELQQQARSNKK